jgi:hypothetical protein
VGPIRHVYFQQAAPGGLRTEDQRAEASLAMSGLVQGARYFHRPTPSWLRRVLARWLAPPPEESSVLRFELPFDADGGDALALCDEEVPLLDGAEPVGEIRRVLGKIVCLEPRTDGDEVVLLDFWQDVPPVWRIVQSVDFGVLPRDGPPVAVCCAMAPLVIAPPEERSVGELLSLLEPRGTALVVRSAEGSAPATGFLLELREGDLVEVTGLTCEPSASVKRFDVSGRRVGYRGAPRVIDLIIGDAPGTRLLVRKLG